MFLSPEGKKWDIWTVFFFNETFIFLDVWYVFLDLILYFKLLAVSPCSTIANLGQRSRASSRKLTHYWQLPPPAAAAEVFPGAQYRGLAVYLDVSLSPCGILVEETKRQAAYPLFWQGT